MPAELMRRGIVPLHGIAEAMDAAEAAAFIGEAWARRRSPLLAAGRRRSGRRGDRGLRATLRERAHASTRPRPRRCCRAPGLPVPPGRARRQSPTRRCAAAEALGFPVALKALGVAHKSEHGAVRLNLRDARQSVRAAASDSSALGTGLYVERMVQGGVAELIVGVTRDPLFGPVMTIGTGGVLVELLKDSATLLLPATARRHRGRAARPEAVSAARRLSRPAKADLEAAIDAISGIAAFRAGAMPTRSRNSTSIR